MAEYIYGGKGVLFWVTQLSTFAILILAATPTQRADQLLRHYFDDRTTSTPMIDADLDVARQTDDARP